MNINKITYRNSLHRRLLDGSPRMSTLNATNSPNDSSQNVTTDVSLSASINGDNFSTVLSPMPSGTSSLIIRRPSSNMFVILLLLRMTAFSWMFLVAFE